VIGAFLAEELTKSGVISMNAHKSLYVLTPESSISGQMIFRGELRQWINGKNVLLLLASATTGATITRAVETLIYYGAKISGISAIFSIASKIGNLPVQTIFTQADLPDYLAHSPKDCPMCKKGLPINGICNGYGMSPIE
jgi:orotate phosphoribosyltransferase